MRVISLATIFYADGKRGVEGIISPQLSDEWKISDLWIGLAQLFLWELALEVFLWADE